MNIKIKLSDWELREIVLAHVQAKLGVELKVHDYGFVDDDGEEAYTCDGFAIDCSITPAQTLQLLSETVSMQSEVISVEHEAV
jgi:hypothetical protein